MAVTQLKDGRWVVYYRVAGKIKKEYFGRGLDAKKQADQRNAELQLKNRRPAARGPFFWELAKAYVQHKDFSPNSRKHLLIRLDANILPYFGDKEAAGLTDADMDGYKSARRAKGVKNSTIAREMTDVKAILNFATKRRPPLIPFNPIRDYQKPTHDDAVITPPSQAEISAILKEASPHLKRAILLSYYMGLRPGAVELLRLKWDHVQWDHQVITVASASKGKNKTPRTRHVPIHPSLWPLLHVWHAQDHAAGYIIHYKGQPIKTIKTSWSGAMQRSGITRRLRPYDLRHVFVSQALEAGADPKALSDIVGSRAQTLIKHYQHVSRAMHRAAMHTIPALPGGDTLGDTSKISPKIKKNSQ